MRAMVTTLAALILSIVLTSCAAVTPPERPRLVVVVSFDQLRGDMVPRYLKHMGTEGFARVIREGARYDSCYYDHANNITGPGHAVIMTGCYPYRTGITTNQLCDREEGTCFYCAGDANGVLGPHALMVPTVGDKLIEADPRSKVVSVSLKDRSAIMMAGHTATACIWLDHKTLCYATSSAYPTPSWLGPLNEAFPITAYSGQAFEKVDEGYRRDVLLSSFSVENLFNAASELVRLEKLGSDEHADILAIGVSTTDYVGHSFGPDSREMKDILIQCDRSLAHFITMLDETVGRTCYRLVITSDHGVSPIPESLLANRAPDEPLLDAGRITEEEIVAFVDSALTTKYGDPLPRSWFKKVYIPDIYLDEQAAAAVGVTVEDLAATAAHALGTLHGIELAITRTDVMNNAIPSPPDIATLIKRSFHPQRSGDVMLYPRRYWVLDADPADHGTYHDYDRWVEMMLMGPEVTGRGWKGKVSPADIAPTIANWLGIDLGPVDGKPLPLN